MWKYYTHARFIDEKPKIQVDKWFTQGHGHGYLGWNPNDCHMGANALHCPNMRLG